MRYIAYEGLIYEFYSSLQLSKDPRGTILDYTMKFRLGNFSWTVKPEELASWLECDCEGILDMPGGRSS